MTDAGGEPYDSSLEALIDAAVTPTYGAFVGLYRVWRAQMDKLPPRPEPMRFLGNVRVERGDRGWVPDPGSTWVTNLATHFLTTTDDPPPLDEPVGHDELLPWEVDRP
ncbi:MAG: hypothetical protein L3K23_10475 [Thermoplasmata archaeon]|nr:hypothetical protein [Thermoplasmata archaeon]